MNTIEPKSGLETGVWFNNQDWITFEGDQAIVLDGFHIRISDENQPERFHMCIVSHFKARQTHRDALWNNVERWMILPP